MKVSYPRLEKTCFWTWWIGNSLLAPIVKDIYVPIRYAVELTLLNIIHISFYLCCIGLLSFVTYIFTQVTEKKTYKRKIFSIGFIIMIGMSISDILPLVINGNERFVDRNLFGYSLLVIISNILLLLRSGIIISLALFVSRFIYDYYGCNLLKSLHVKYYFIVPLFCMVIGNIILPTGWIYIVAACIIYIVLAYRKVPVKVVELLPWEEEPAHK